MRKAGPLLSSVGAMLALLAATVRGAGVDAPTLARLKALAFAHEFPTLSRSIEAMRPEADPSDPSWLAALSWAARGAGFVNEWEQADAYASETYDAARALVVGGRSIESTPELEIALGAAIEVLGKVRDAAGDRSGAVAFLKAESERFRGTAIETRIQKNLLLISLEGEPMPRLASDEGYVGAARPLENVVKDKVALFFFWAHWCGDCKKQRPILDRLQREYGSRGLVVVGPTRRYGYISRGEDADKETELAYLRGPYQKSYPTPEWMTAPISSKNFVSFGVSTTPTLVLADRKGVVRLYHPGWMTYEDLKAKIETLL